MGTESFVASPKEAAQSLQLSPEPVSAPSDNRGWQKARRTLVPPQGGIKAPYVPGPNRCSCGVTPALSPPCHLPVAASPSAALTAPIHRDIPSQGRCRSPSGALGRGCDSVRCQKPFSHPTRPLSFPCRRFFCYAITFNLGTGRKRGFKILFKAS